MRYGLTRNVMFWSALARTGDAGGRTTGVSLGKLRQEKQEPLPWKSPGACRLGSCSVAVTRFIRHPLDATAFNNLP